MSAFSTRVASPMYASDVAHHGLLGPSKFEPLASAASLLDSYRKCEQYVEWLSSLGDDEIDSSVMDGVDVRTDYDRVNSLWIFEFHNNMLEVDGTAISDHWFLHRCLVMCVRDSSIRDMATLDSIHELYAQMQLLGCNHTRTRFEMTDSRTDVLTLERRCACLIVFFLTHDHDSVLARMKGVLPAIDSLLMERVHALKHVPDPDAAAKSPVAAAAGESDSSPSAQPPAPAPPSRQRDTRQQRIESMMKSIRELEDADDPSTRVVSSLDVNEGDYWHADHDTVVRNFIPFASRVFQRFHLESAIYKDFVLLDVDALNSPVYPQIEVECFTSWVTEKSSYDLDDGFVKTFRDIVYEHWLPVNSRNEVRRSFETKFEADMTSPLSLLHSQLGADSTASIETMARQRIHQIASNTGHEMYEFLVLAQFCYMFGHRFKGDFRANDFMLDYYISPANLVKHRGRLAEKSTYGYKRRPILVRLLRSWMLHDVDHWILCTSLTDALLKWMKLIVKYYDGSLAAGVSIAAFIEELTTPKKIPQL